MRLLVAIITFNRPDSLSGLMHTVSGMRIPPDCTADMVISLDGGGDAGCAALMEAFAWPHGKLTLIHHPENLGLREHVLRTGNLVADYDALVMLEEDLLVSPALLEHVVHVVSQAGEWEDVFQFALYTPAIHEFYELPFTPVPLESETWYARVPCSWGQCWTRRQWQNFRAWLQANPSCPTLEKIQHPAAGWGPNSWKRHFFEYLLQKEGWVLYPRVSLTTNTGVPGVHFKKDARYFRVPLALSPQTSVIPSPAVSESRYDEWFEPLPDTLGLSIPDPAELDVDLYGMKPAAALSKPRVLTRRTCAGNPSGFRDDLAPLELNVRLELTAPSGDAHLRIVPRAEIDPNLAPSDFFLRHMSPTLEKVVVRRERHIAGEELHRHLLYRVARFLTNLIQHSTKMFRK